MASVVTAHYACFLSKFSVPVTFLACTEVTSCWHWLVIAISGEINCVPHK